MSGSVPSDCPWWGLRKPQECHGFAVNQSSPKIPSFQVAPPPDGPFVSPQSRQPKDRLQVHVALHQQPLHLSRTFELEVLDVGTRVAVAPYRSTTTSFAPGFCQPCYNAQQSGSKQRLGRHRNRNTASRHLGATVVPASLLFIEEAHQASPARSRARLLHSGTAWMGAPVITPHDAVAGLPLDLAHVSTPPLLPLLPSNEAGPASSCARLGGKGCHLPRPHPALFSIPHIYDATTSGGQ